MAQPKTDVDDRWSPPQPRRRRQVKIEYDAEVSRVKTEHWEPPDWKKQLGFIREMRRGRDAPVDNMGAEKCYDTEAPANVGWGEGKKKPFNHSGAWRCFLIHFRLLTGETFPGVGVPHAVQSDQGPGDGSSDAEAPSSRLHRGQAPGHR